MLKCARPDCHVPAKESCSGCDRERYCGRICQNSDWKIHKLLCPILTKLSIKLLQPFREIIPIIYEILLSKKGDDIRILEHLLIYVDYQFGNRVIGKTYRERVDGERISNYEVEVDILYHINKRLSTLYSHQHSLNMIARNDSTYPVIKRSLDLLNPWLLELDSGCSISYSINSLHEEQSDFILEELFRTEHNMTVVIVSRGDFDLAEGHCQRCLAYSQRLRVEGEKKTSSIFEALSVSCHLRQQQGRDSEAVVFAEECYNLVVETYDPAHLEVQVC